MKLTLRSSNTALLSITILVLAVGTYTTANYLFPPVDDTSNALTYGSSTNVSFTFDPKLSIALSTDNLTIGDIVPGTIKDSNSITVAVSSNTPYGYTLSANVGSNDSTSTYYNTSNLIHEDNTINNTFTSIATNASEETLTTDNTWGYSTSIDNGNTWSTYSGLSNTNKTLLDTNNPASSSTIDFKVAAKSSTTQASGTYNNIITFYAVGKPRPPYMQETERIKSQLVNIGDEMQAIDQRDGKKYWVTKLADGNIWMTQNLDLDIVAGRTYTAQDTDLAYSVVDNSWTPSSEEATHATIHRLSNTAPESYDPGDLYWNGIPNNSWNGNFYNETVANPTDTPGGTHYHIGNYYNWTAATAMSDSSSYDGYRDAGQSICPAGWRLPTNRGDESFQNLLTPYGWTDNDRTLDNDQKSWNEPLYFVLGGRWTWDPTDNFGSVGFYWTNVAIESKFAYSLHAFFSVTLNQTA